MGRPASFYPTHRRTQEGNIATMIEHGHSPENSHPEPVQEDYPAPAPAQPAADLPPGHYRVEEVEPAQPARPTVDSLRPAPAAPVDNRVPDNVRQPEDRKAAVDAQRGEADDDENRRVVCLYNGVRFEFRADDLTFEFQLAAERGQIATALLQLLGEKQFNTLLKWPLRHYQGLANAIGKASGMGNS
jgi:hypothetical protein